MNNREIVAAIRKFKGKLIAPFGGACFNVVIEKQYMIGILMEMPEDEQFEIDVIGAAMFINSLYE